MTWTANSYCSRSDLKLALDPLLSNVDDTFLDSLIAQAQAYMDTEIGYSFQQDGTSSTPASRVYDGPARGQAELWIDDLVALFSPVSGSVFETAKNTYLSSGGIWITGSVTTTDITADIILHPNNYLAAGVPARRLARQSGSFFLEGSQNYQVLGIFGQPVQPGQIYNGVPNDIMRATIRLAVHYYKMRDTAYADMMQEQGGVRERYVKNVPIDVVEIIENYKHRRFLTR